MALPQPQPTTLHHSNNPVAAYSELPHVCFRGQETGEQVEILLRRHIITNLRWIVPSIIGLLIPPLIYLSHIAHQPGFESLATIPDTTIFLAEILWYVVIIGYALESFLSWYYNVYLVTSIRLVDVDFIGLLQYASTEAELRQVQDVEHKQVGLWQLLFNYGTVEIQTAGIRQDLVFEKVPKPNRVADIITDLLPEEARARQNSVTKPIPDQEILS
jgi:hypothetical protein